MIIDVTREFSDEEYKDYLNLVERFDEKFWRLEMYRDESYKKDDIIDYDQEGYIINYPLYSYDELLNFTTANEDNLMNELSNRVNKCIKHLKNDGYIIIERLLNFEMVMWLNRHDAQYYVIYDPLEYDFFDIAIKDKDVYTLFAAKWGMFIDEEFLKGRGWFKDKKLKTAFQIEWCEENLKDDFIRGLNYFYFTEEGYMMYKLRWL